MVQFDPKFDLNFDPKDVEFYINSFYELAQQRSLHVQTIGMIGSYPLLLAFPKQHIPNVPNVLISAGFHGEEPAGSWGLLQFLKSSKAEDLFTQANISLLPLVNPTGIKSGHRYNDWNENPNGGFCHVQNGDPSMSREGKMLLSIKDDLVSLARDGFISLHEDIDLKEFYFYTFEQSDLPGAFSKMLYSVESKFFNPVSDGALYEGGAEARDALIFNHCDGSFEDFMFHQGVPRTACTETPGAMPIVTRIDANEAIIKSFIEYHISRNLKDED